MNNFEQFINEKVSKIACLECDTVNTEKAWQKNGGFCPSCKVSSQGVAESVITESITVLDERPFGKKGLIIMLQNNNETVSAIFKDKKNANKFNRNKAEDLKKLLDLANKTKFPGAIDESVNEAFKFNKNEVLNTANLIASAISKLDKVSAKVHDLEFDKGQGAGFEISIDGEKYAGGSYTVKPNGDVVNSAIGNSAPNAVYAKIGDTNLKKVMKNIRQFESTVTEAKKFYTTKDIVKIANNAGNIVIDAKSAIQDLAVAYGDKVPAKELDKVLVNYDLDLKDHELMEGKKVTLKRKYTEKHPAITAGKHARIRNKMLEAIGDGKITQEEFDNILKELSSNSKKWSRNNAKYFNVSEEGISLTKFGRRALASITINEEEPEVDKKPLEMKINESNDESGLMIKGRTRADNQKIDDILDDLGLHAEWEAREGYFFLPEEEDMFDELEAMIQKEFDKKNVNAYFEGVFESTINEATTRTAMEIAALTGTNKNFVQEFIDKHNLDIEKVFQYVKKGKLADRMDFVTAIAGKDDNHMQKKLIKKFVNESITEKTRKNPEIYVPGGFDKDVEALKTITYDDIKKLAKKHKVFLEDAIKYVEYGWDVDIKESKQTSFIYESFNNFIKNSLNESISTKDIKIGSEFKVGNDIFKVEKIENDKKFGQVVSSSRIEKGGKKYEYRDTMDEFVSFLNDENAKLKK